MKDKVRDINGAFVYYTDCQVATLERLMLLKSSPKSEIVRQTSICEGMVRCMKECVLDPSLGQDIAQVEQRFREALAIER